ncbi:leucine-rich repeat and WD repeat-containing protein 1 isoform X2 [Myripristis murdjan]|uniref:leucine-rich repeat and WD repeat-containing protein 1 isoform X2 n=1 Tax=Myripristis murdjan TaxID=586833 RepID=UPI001175FDFE|nr:leucine-rich repeat and WD repeat-containing protein 1 isoform X2 [Myripristis murdjan]
MVKITEELLLEKGSPKTSKLEQITTLNLSKLGLKAQDLPVRLLSRLQSLERWDLSGNGLQELPRGLELPELRFLDLSDNQMEDVTTLDSLTGLEELKMEDNIYITVSDNYKLMVLLPKLRIYNGKDISITANNMRFTYSSNLQHRMIAVWEKSFCLPDPITPGKMSALEKEFVNTVRDQVKFGPNSISDFTKWRVEMLAKEYLRSLTEPKEENGENQEPADTKSCNVTSPVKRKQKASLDLSNIRLTPLKKSRADLPASPAELTPRKSSRFQLTPQKSQITTSASRSSPRKTAQPSSTPVKGQSELAERPRRGSREDRQDKQSIGTSKKDVKATKLQKEIGLVPKIKSYKTQPVCLKPHHVLQCHSKQDSPDDFTTQLWACAFQPPLDHRHDGVGGSRLVATCGGDSLCLIDCETGMVMKKYKVSGEEFFSLAWSTVLMSREGGASARLCSILAAGGKRGLVKLIHPRNNIAYGEFRASRKALSVLHFNPRQGTFLFTGSYDNKITMWDIGGVDSQYNFKVNQLLALDVSSTPLHICLPPASPNTHLLAACEDGLHCYNTQLGTSTTKRSKEMEVTFPIYKEQDKDHDYRTIDGLRFVTDDIVASKSCSQGSIYLWSWSRTKAQQPDRKTREVCAVLLAELQWATTEIPYLSLNTCPGEGYIACGDDKGRLWTYHVTNLQGTFQAGKPIPPTEVLEWPNPVSRGQVDGPSINSVAVDPELCYLVALSDKNMVVVWKRVDSS